MSKQLCLPLNFVFLNQILCWLPITRDLPQVSHSVDGIYVKTISPSCTYSYVSIISLHKFYPLFGADSRLQTLKDRNICLKVWWHKPSNAKRITYMWQTSNSRLMTIVMRTLLSINTKTIVNYATRNSARLRIPDSEVIRSENKPWVR